MIVTQRTVIKPITWEDFDAYVLTSQDPDVVKYIGNGKVNSREEHRQRWEERFEYMAAHPGLGVFYVFDKDTHERIGTCNLNRLDKTDKIHVGYRIHKELWGLGYATEICRAMLKYGFEEMNLKLITACVDQNHKPSQKVLQKSGMRYVDVRTLYEFELMYYELTKFEYGQL